jgi:STE24 endopeptidase
VPTTYTLPPALAAKAIALNHQLFDLHFARELWPVALLLLLLELHVPTRLASFAATRTARPWLQTFLFAIPFFLLLGILELPTGIAAHHILFRFGLSIQHWPGWFADAAKAIAINVVVGTLLALLIFWRIRASTAKAPRRWWLQAWIIAVLCILFGVLVTPVIIDPLFNKFEPLTQTDPALVAQLEQVVARSGMSIPPDRIFLMRASAKTTEANAYVTGFGASKRVVVWDTTIKNMPPGEISFLFAHEMGHYVLRHIPRGIAFAAAMLWIGFWLGARAVSWLLKHFGERWQIKSLQDPAALAVLLLVFSVLQIAAEPIGNAFSRHIEHAADVYGQEAIHGIVPNPQATAASSFQRLGEQNLATPERRPFVEWWAYDHPAAADRIAFAAAYDPWTAGAHPKYFEK